MDMAETTTTSLEHNTSTPSKSPSASPTKSRTNSRNKINYPPVSKQHPLHHVPYPVDTIDASQIENICELLIQDIKQHSTLIKTTSTQSNFGLLDAFSLEHMDQLNMLLNRTIASVEVRDISRNMNNSASNNTATNKMKGLFALTSFDPGQLIIEYRGRLRLITRLEQELGYRETSVIQTQVLFPNAPSDKAWWEFEETEETDPNLLIIDDRGKDISSMTRWIRRSCRPNLTIKVVHLITKKKDEETFNSLPEKFINDLCWIVATKKTIHPGQELLLPLDYGNPYNDGVFLYECACGMPEHCLSTHPGSIPLIKQPYAVTPTSQRRSVHSSNDLVSGGSSSPQSTGTSPATRRTSTPATSSNATVTTSVGGVTISSTTNQSQQTNKKMSREERKMQRYIEFFARMDSLERKHQARKDSLKNKQDHGEQSGTAGSNRRKNNQVQSDTDHDEDDHTMTMAESMTMTTSTVPSPTSSPTENASTTVSRTSSPDETLTTGVVDGSSASLVSSLSATTATSGSSSSASPEKRDTKQKKAPKSKKSPTHAQLVATGRSSLTSSTTHANVLDEHGTSSSTYISSSTSPFSSTNQSPMQGRKQQPTVPTKKLWMSSYKQQQELKLALIMGTTLVGSSSAPSSSSQNNSSPEPPQPITDLDLTGMRLSNGSTPEKMVVSLSSSSPTHEATSSAGGVKRTTLSEYLERKKLQKLQLQNDAPIAKADSSSIQFQHAEALPLAQPSAIKKISPMAVEQQEHMSSSPIMEVDADKQVETALSSSQTTRSPDNNTKSPPDYPSLKSPVNVHPWSNYSGHQQSITSSTLSTSGYEHIHLNQQRQLHPSTQHYTSQYNYTEPLPSHYHRRWDDRRSGAVEDDHHYSHQRYHNHRKDEDSYNRNDHHQDTRSPYQQRQHGRPQSHNTPYHQNSQYGYQGGNGGHHQYNHHHPNYNNSNK